ncbi:MAG: peptidyl-tRNA hydrolase Pth2 [Candidatus Saliniplasma sp.]
MGFDYKMVLVVSRDLKLSPGKLAVQVSHAAVKCALDSRDDDNYFRKWYREGQKKVVVKCDDLEHMKFLKEMAEKEGLTTCLVRDAGLTEVEPGTVTCLGIGPGPNNLLDKITGDLSLL